MATQLFITFSLQFTYSLKIRGKNSITGRGTHTPAQKIIDIIY